MNLTIINVFLLQINAKKWFKKEVLKKNGVCFQNVCALMKMFEYFFLPLKHSENCLPRIMRKRYEQFH